MLCANEWMYAGGWGRSRARSALVITIASAPSVSRQLSKRQSGSEIHRASRYCSRVSSLWPIVAAWSRVYPYWCIARRVSIAISSTGRSTPQGRLHCWCPARRSATCDHGRLAAAERFRARHATATSHCPVATAMAAWPTTPHPAPPPKPTCENQVMSPSPTLRAMSTSRPSSIENSASPSTSDGSRPASSMAMLTAWHARESSESGRPLPNAVWPMPTTAVASWSGIIGPSVPAPGRLALLHQRGHPLLAVLAAEVELDVRGLGLEHGGARVLARVVHELLRPP